ncbi:MAG TPA: hypothetical protein VFD58_24060 [Blastocatellia bacterium]|nr:hypothetical protein [Blastocatellia bacterium]
MPEMKFKSIWWRVILVFALMLLLAGSFVVYQTLPPPQPEPRPAPAQAK